MSKLKIGDFLIRKKELVEIKDDELYNRLTIKTKNQGVFLRDQVKGANIGTKKQFMAKSGQFIVSKIDAMNGAFGILPKTIKQAVITGNFWAYDIVDDIINIEWFNLFVSLPNFIQLCSEFSSGTTHRKYLDENKFLNYEIEIPSLSKQQIAIKKYNEKRRIVDKFLKEIAVQQRYTDMLRQSILQQAIEGKLCKQNPDDEPASVLLDKIKEEKKKLVEDGKIRKQKELPPISDYEKPFELPQGWEWSSLGSLYEINPRNDSVPNADVSFIPMKRIESGFTNCHSMEKRKWIDIKKGFVHIKNNDIGVAKITPCFENRKSVIFKNLYNGIGAATTELYVLRDNTNILLNQFVLYCIKSNRFITNGVLTYTGTAGQQRVSRCFIENYLIAIPPLQEQHRIVEKVDCLMRLCDKLENEVSKADTYASQLMESVLQEAFSTKEAKQENRKGNVVKVDFTTQRQKVVPFTFAAAARGNIKQSTLESLQKRAIEIVNGEE